MYHKILCLIVICVIASSVSADEIFTHFTICRSNKYFFAIDDQEGGSCYEIRSSKSFKSLWKTKGWYSAPGTMHLADDGRHLVRMRLISSNSIKANQQGEIAIEFYLDGATIKTVKFDELIDINVALNNGPPFAGEFLISGTLVYVPELADQMSENDWMKFLDRDEKESVQHFLCKTAFGRVIVFDIKTGKIIFDGKKKVPRTVVPLEEIFKEMNPRANQ